MNNIFQINYKPSLRGYLLWWFILLTITSLVNVNAAPGDILYQNQFNNNGQLNGDWTRTSGNGNDFQTSNSFSSSPSRSLRIRDGSGGISNSGLINALVPNAEVSFWIRQHTGSRGPEAGEDLEFSYLNDVGVWIAVTTFLGSDPINPVTFTFQLPADALHGDLRFQFNMTSGNNNDRWYVDDFTVTETAPAEFIPPVAIDDSGNTVTSGTTNIDLAANDTDVGSGIDISSIVISSAPANGAVIVNDDGTVDYTHDGGVTSVDSFTYTISDLAGNVSNVATVSVTIQVLSCDNFSDDFDGGGFNDNTGTQNFSSGWNVRSVTISGLGFVSMTNNRLRLQGNNRADLSLTGPYDFDNNWAERNASLGAYTSAILSFDFIAVGNLEVEDEAIVEISNDGGASFTTLQVFNGFTTTTTVPVSYDISAFISTTFDTRVRIRIQEDTNANSCCFGANGEYIEIDNFDIEACTVAAAIDHIEIIHDGVGLTCNPEIVTLKACANADCSVPATVDAAVSLFASGQPSTISPATVVIPANFAAGMTVSLSHTTVEVVNLSAVSVPAATGAIQCSGSVSGCNMEFFDSGFIFDVPPQTSCQTSANVVIRAVKSDDVSQQCVPGFANKNVNLKFWTNYIAPATGAGNQTTLNYAATDFLLATTKGTDVPVSFDVNGEINITVNYPDAGDQSFNVSFDGITGSDTGLVMNGVDNFVTVPAKLRVFSTTANADCASNDANCSAFVVAGAAFNLSVAAACADDSITPNFEMNNIPLNISTIAPVSGNPVSLGISTVSVVDADNGNHQLPNQAISEVGVFTITAAPAAGAYHGETVPTAVSASIGRFIPDRFLVSDNAPAFMDGDNSWSCGFTYQQQPFDFAVGLNPILEITAVNEAGAATLNYGASFWKLATNAANRTYINQAGGISALLSADTSTSIVTLTGTADFADGLGSLSISGDTFEYQKAAATPALTDAPFAADAVLNVPVADLQDTDGVCFDGDNDGNCDFYVSPNINGTQIRWGRWMLENAFGSELEALPLVAVAQQFDGTLFQINTDDTCSTTDASWATPLLSNYTDNLNATETVLTESAMVSGLLQMSLSAPGEGNNGSALVTIPMATWMYYDFDGDSTAEATSATVTFGIFKGKSPVIYWRQKFGN